LSSAPRRRQLFMDVLRQHLEERPTAERSSTQLGEAVGLSRSTIWRQLRKPSTTRDDELELRSHIQTIALEMRTYGYRPISNFLRAPSFEPRLKAIPWIKPSSRRTLWVLGTIVTRKHILYLSALAW
jgi:hypothetical protein